MGFFRLVSVRVIISCVNVKLEGFSSVSVGQDGRSVGVCVVFQEDEC